MCGLQAFAISTATFTRSILPHLILKILSRISASRISSSSGLPMTLAPGAMPVESVLRVLWFCCKPGRLRAALRATVHFSLRTGVGRSRYWPMVMTSL